MIEGIGDDGAPGGPERARGWAVLLFLVVFLVAGLDLLEDAREGTSFAHLVVEGALMVLSLAGASLFWRELRSARREARSLARDVDRARAEAVRWREEAAEILQGLGVTISGQFDRWDLSEAERQVALLLLKGLSHREVARVRGTSERTVREQAAAVYRKADLRGRSELSAFFLEDLLLPPVRDR